MKLHLPVRLFRAIVVLCSLISGVATTVASMSYAAAPEDAVEVILINEDDLARAEHTVNDREFLVKADLLFDGVSSPYMGADAESWYFSGTPELSMIFTHATNRVFDVAETKTLEFDGFEDILFDANVKEVNGGGAIYLGSSATLNLIANKNVVFSGNQATCNHGGTIYGVSSSSIMLNDNGSVKFCANSSWYGGAMYGGAIILNNNKLVEFSENSASTWNYAKGGAVYGNTVTLNGNDRVTFSRNSTTGSTDDNYTVYGGAIYGREVTLSNNKYVEFLNNSADNGDQDGYGGAIYGSTITLNDNESVTFIGNKASSYGGAIYGYSNSTITLSGNGSVEFSGNLGGAISSGNGRSTITLSRNSSVTFRNSGGIEARDGGTLTMSENDKVTFSGNGIHMWGTSAITLSNNGSVEFNVGGIQVSTYSNNSTIKLLGNGSVTFSNGGISGYDAQTIELSNNGSVSFSSKNSYKGSAISVGEFSSITLSNNDSVTFSGCEPYYTGEGVLNGDQFSTITLNGNRSVTFSKNLDGAIRGGTNSTITLSNNGSVTFIGNSDPGNGGVICGGWKSMIELSGNESLTFSENKASSYGGAIYGDRESMIELRGNESLTFSGNTASSSGGAIYGYRNSTITMSDNGSVTISGNKASSYGGAIYGVLYSTITLSDNGSVTFSGNTASSGGAIDAYGNLSIRNNDSVLFEKNAEKSAGSYRLRSIYARGSGATIYLSAAEGKSIEFRDAVYIASGSTVNLNEDYTDAAGAVHKQTGDIIFTGKYIEQHLSELLAADGLTRTATAEEILNSRTTEVKAMTNLYGGCLRVEDGAIYKGYGITAMGNSAACVRVKDAVLEHGGYDIMLNPGTKLEVEGASAITADELVMKEGSSLSFVLGEKNKSTHALTLTGTLVLNGAVSLVLDDELQSGLYRLMKYTELTGDVAQLEAGLPEHYELAWKNNEAALIVWQHLTLPREESEWNEFYTYTKANAESDVVYNSVRLNGGIHEVSGSGSMGVGGLLSVTEGADVTLAVNAFAMAVEVGDDSSLSIRKGLNLVSLTMQADEGTEETKAISVGRNAELCLTEATLLGQVATADETSAVYYQTEAGDKLLKFTGEMGEAGLNLTLGEDGKTVSATDSAGFTGNITVLSGTTLVNEATSTTDGLPFGDTYATAADKTITVQGGATLDINGRETYYHLVLEKDALLTNSGTDAHLDWKGIPVIDLSGDAEVNATAQICMVGANYASTILNLNGNTLTKTGSANLVLRNTSINEGTLAVNGGLVRFRGNTSTAAGTGIQVNNGGTLWISEGTGNYAGSLVLNTGGHVYLGEGPSGTLGGDNGTNSQTISLTGLGKLELAGGTMTFRGEKLNMGTVDVTAASTLELWDQTGSNGVATTASTISTLNMSANLNLATTWKSSLDIARLTGSGELLVGSSRQKHKVSVQDLSGFTGTFAIRGANSTLSLKLSGDDEMNAARVTKDDSAVLILEGSGTYCFSNLENVAAAATGISDIQFGDTWSGKIALRNSTATGMELDDFGGAGKTIVIDGVSGWFAYNRTVESHLQLVESGLTLLDTSKKTYTYTGGISGSGDFTIKSKTNSTYTGTYDLSGDLSAWAGAFRVQQSGDNSNTAPVNLNLAGGGTLFSGSEGSGIFMERLGEMNVTIGNAGTATTMRGDIRNVGVTNEGTTTYGTLNVTLNNTVDAQGDIIASRINVGAGADINFSGTVQANQWTVGDDARLVVESGSKVYLSEADSGTLRGDLGTNDVGTLNLTRTAGVELAGGTLFYRGKNITFGSVDVTEDSVLEIWDQTGVDGVASHACTIDTLNLNASLEQKTTWKCTLEIGSLTGSGPLTVTSRNEKHYVTLNDVSAYTGTVSISGANTTLTLNIVKDAVVNASLVTKDNTSHLVLKGQGSYNIGTARSLAEGVCFAEDWEGSVRLTGALAGETLSGLNQESSWVELFGVSGYLSQADAAAGAQTYGMNLKLTDAGETAAWNLNNGWNGDVRTFTGMVCGTGTLNRNHYKGTEQTLIFAGDVSGWSGALEHNATSATNNGQKVKTNVTFNGSSEINVAMRTNGKGELNVTLDDANLAAGSKVTVNNAVSATNFSVTEGTAARLNSTLQLSGMAELRAAASLELGNVVTLSAGTETATMETVSVSDSEIRGTEATSAIRNMHLGDMNGDFSIANVGMHAVDISGSNATLTLANVNLDDTCSINLGSGGSISFADSMLGITLAELPVAGTDTLHIDCSALLQSSAYGNLELNFNFTTEEMCNRGYQTLSVEFGAAADYSNLELSLSKAEFKGFVGSIAQFKLVPEPTTTTLSLLALSALVARRRRR